MKKLVEIQRKEDLIIKIIGCPPYWLEVERTVPEPGRMKFIRSCCGAGTRYATILYDGTVYPCMLLPIYHLGTSDRSPSPRYGGNLRSSEILEIDRS